MVSAMRMRTISRCGGVCSPSRREIGTRSTQAFVSPDEFLECTINTMKKKILFINNNLGGGGAERNLIDILRNFDYDRYDVDLVLISGTGVYMEDIHPMVNYLGSIYDQKTDIYDFSSSKVRFDGLKEALGIERLVKGNYDTIVSFLEGYSARYHQYIRHKALNNVSWIHTDLLVNHWSQKCYESDQEEAEIYSLMDKVVFVSQSALDDFCRLFHYKKDNLLVINNPIDKKRVECFANKQKFHKKDFSFVAVGRFFHEKRYDRMLQAVKILKNRGCVFHLDILGTGKLEVEMKKLACALGVENIVMFHGFVHNPYPYIKNADVLLLSSDAEGFPTVICEAMILGVPVIGTNVAGTRDLLGDSEYGLLTDLSPESFADAMCQFYADADKRSYYAAKSLDRAKSLSQEEAMRRIYAVL